MGLVESKNNLTSLTVEDNKLYIDRINELNEIIGELNKENEELKMKLKSKQTTLDKYKKYYICKYTPYMVSDVIYDNFFVRISSRAIVKEAANNNLFNNEMSAIRIPRKKGSKEKYASTVLFSIAGIAEILIKLSLKFSINLEISKDYFEKSIKQLKEGKVKHYTMNKLKAMEK